MKKLLLLIVLTGGILMSTSCKTLSGDATSDKKKIELRRDSIKHAAALKALEDMDFVLQADRLTFKRGKSAYVQTLTNFVSSHDGRTVVQVAPFYGGGPNGVGGVTLEGKASNIKINPRKNGGVSASMSIMGSGGSATIEIELYKYSNRARAVISSNFRSDRITLEGIILPYAEKSTYTGMPL